MRRNSRLIHKSQEIFSHFFLSIFPRTFLYLEIESPNHESSMYFRRLFGCTAFFCVCYCLDRNYEQEIVWIQRKNSVVIRETLDKGEEKWTRYNKEFDECQINFRFCLFCPNFNAPWIISSVWKFGWKMKEPSVLELLWQNCLCYEHILQTIFLYLDSSAIRNLKLASMEMRNFCERILWQNKRSNRCLQYRLKNR